MIRFYKLMLSTARGPRFERGPFFAQDDESSLRTTAVSGRRRVASLLASGRS